MDRFWALVTMVLLKCAAMKEGLFLLLVFFIKTIHIWDIIWWTFFRKNHIACIRQTFSKYYIVIQIYIVLTHFIKGLIGRKSSLCYKFLDLNVRTPVHYDQLYLCPYHFMASIQDMCILMWSFKIFLRCQDMIWVDVIVCMSWANIHLDHSFHSSLVTL